jgi:hypothetical protein
MANNGALNVRCGARENCLKCKFLKNHQQKRAFYDFDLILKLLIKNHDCELMGCKLKRLFEMHDFDIVGSIVFQMPNGKEARFIDLVGPCRKGMGGSNLLAQPT